MTNLQFYQLSGTNCYKRKNQRTQFMVTAFILFSIAAWFLLKAPSDGGYVAAAVAVLLGLLFLNRMFNSVFIDLDREVLVQKSSLLASVKTVPLSDIQGFSVHNRIYGLILISTATAVVRQGTETAYVLLCQNIMNTKNSEYFLLETEQILKINDR